MTKMIHVVILDDHPGIIDGYRSQLTSEQGFKVVGTASYGEDLAPLMAENHVDVLIMDIELPVSAQNPNPFPTLKVIPDLLENHPNLSILAISMHDSQTLIKGIMEAGASGYLLKDDQTSYRELPAIVRLIAEGGIHLSKRAQDRWNKHNLNHEEPLLTKRQKQAVSLCAAYPDDTTSELAARLGVAHSTVRNLLSGAYLRLGVSHRAAAIAKARQLGIITPEKAEPDFSDKPE